MLGSRLLLVGLALLFVLLQLRLWFGDGSLEERAMLQRELDAQKSENARLELRNQVVEREIQAFEDDPDDAVEARAREDLGLIKDGETFYLVTEEDDPQMQDRPGSSE